MMTDVSDEELALSPEGIGHGLSGGAWEHYWDFDIGSELEPETESTSSSDEKYERVGSSFSAGSESVERINLSYNHGLASFFSRLSLKDIDQSMFVFVLNKSLAEKIRCIRAYANEYQLQEISQPQFSIDTGQNDPDFIPVKFSDAEVSDVWVRIRPVRASAFSISFSSQTPKRVVPSRETP